MNWQLKVCVDISVVIGESGIQISRRKYTVDSISGVMFHTPHIALLYR